MTNPLKWNLDWKHLTRRESFLMGAPFGATEDRAYRDIVRQLNERKTSDMKAWSGLPEEIREISCCIVNALKTDRVCPSAFFVPNDPADIPFAITLISPTSGTRCPTPLTSLRDGSELKSHQSSGITLTR